MPASAAQAAQSTFRHPPAPPRQCETTIAPCTLHSLLAMKGAMLALDDQQQAARDWFESLRTRICAEFESIEAEAGSDAQFEFIPWDRTGDDATPGGGGVRGQM